MDKAKSLDELIEQAKQQDAQHRNDEAWEDVFAQIADLRIDIYQPEIDKQIADSIEAGEACFMCKRSDR